MVGKRVDEGGRRDLAEVVREAVAELGGRPAVVQFVLYGLHHGGHLVQVAHRQTLWHTSHSIHMAGLRLVQFVAVGGRVALWLRYVQWHHGGSLRMAAGQMTAVQMAAVLLRSNAVLDDRQFDRIRCGLRFRLKVVG